LNEHTQAEQRNGPTSGPGAASAHVCAENGTRSLTARGESLKFRMCLFMLRQLKIGRSAWVWLTWLAVACLLADTLRQRLRVADLTSSVNPFGPMDVFAESQTGRHLLQQTQNAKANASQLQFCGGCDCDCSWANPTLCLNDDGTCCFACCCSGPTSASAPSIIAQSTNGALYNRAQAGPRLRTPTVRVCRVILGHHGPGHCQL
jgi:hypothetical protein